MMPSAAGACRASAPIASAVVSSSATDPLTIREAAPEEFGAVGELLVGAYDAAGVLDGSGYAATLRDVGGRAARASVIVAVDADGTLLGTVTLLGDGGALAEIARAGECEFRMLAVDPTAGRRGVARALVAHIAEAAAARGFARLVCCSKDDMHAAHALYARLGFVREPDRDWSPRAGIRLEVYALGLRPPIISA